MKPTFALTDDARKLQSGNADYFATLVCRLTPQFRKYVQRRLPLPDDTEDVIQDVWTRAFDARRGFGNRGRVDSWLWSICRNVCADRRRLQQRQMARERPLCDEDSGLLAVAAVDQDWGDLTRGEYAELQAHRAWYILNEALVSLSNRQRQVVRYRWVLRYSTRVTAALMHVSPGTVKATLHQAKRHILAQVSIHDA